jgi:threonine synthase
MSSDVTIVCLDCGAPFPFHPSTKACPLCQSGWHTARYDLQEAGRLLEENLNRRPFDVWRYRELLPVTAPPDGFARGEGGTPLLPATNLGPMVGLGHVFIKDETRGPTGSIKDRQAALAVAALLQHGIREAVIASTGNVALAFSAYCARAGIRLWAFLTSLVPADKMNEVALYGTHVVKVTSTYDQAKELAAEFAQRHGIWLERGPRSVASIESMKTIAFETAEQLGRLAPQAPDRSTGKRPVMWREPDWYVQAVSGGIGPLGVLKGFDELRELGWVAGTTRAALIQAEGCAPMVEAWRAGAREAAAIASPATHISTLSTGDPGRAYTLLHDRLVSTGGTMETVSDEAAYRALRIVAKMEGLSVEPAAGAAFAGFLRLAQAGTFHPDDVIVINASGHALPVARERLGESRQQDVVLTGEDPVPSPKEGVYAALEQLDPHRTREIFIIDDDPDSRLLLRRILRAQGEFIVRDFESGTEALAEARRNPPDLILLDLMMPEMDGFDVLTQLKRQEATTQTPVIVVTAKGLTPEERRRLDGKISRLVLKGDLEEEDLPREIRRALE